MLHSGVYREFNRFARRYTKTNIIQKKVAQILVDGIEELRFENVVDLGCGDGAVYRLLKQKNFKLHRFYAVDFSEAMLSLHPQEDTVVKIHADFNDTAFLRSVETEPSKTVVISSSALQWAQNPSALLQALSKLACKHHFAIFTSHTFQTLHRYAGIRSPIPSASDWISAIEAHFDAHIEIRRFELMFDSTLQMLRYIKQSGISGGDKRLSVAQTRALMREYPLNYLEYEVLFAHALPKTQ